MEKYNSLTVLENTISPVNQFFEDGSNKSKPADHDQ